jgi:hypothetical protein
MNSTVPRLKLLLPDLTTAAKQTIASFHQWFGSTKMVN